jgi:putative transposase
MSSRRGGRALFGRMARPLRLEYPGAVYHLTSRGNAKQDIFVDDTDRKIFLRLLGETVTHFGWRLYAYCLMGNHHHLLAETPEPNLSRGMRDLNGTYTQHFNRRHQRVGHLLQGRFKSIVVERETYLLELVRYIALNPVRAGFTRTPEHWCWSSYRSNAGLEDVPPWLTIAPVLARFGEDAPAAARRFQDFVEAGIGVPSPWSELRGQVVLGSDRFAEKLRPSLAAQAISSEVPRVERFAARPALRNVIPLGKASDRIQRNAAIVDAYKNHGYTFADIARHLRLHYSTVSRIAQGGVSQFKT